MNKQLTLNFKVPEGLQIDEANSDLSKGKIALKEIPKKLDYITIVNRLRDSRDTWYECIENGNIRDVSAGCTPFARFSSPDLDSLSSLGALNMLNNVAKYFNDGWKPEARRYGVKYFLYLSFESALSNKSTVLVGNHKTIQQSCVYFKTREHATQALEILGGELVRKALTLNH